MAQLSELRSQLDSEKSSGLYTLNSERDRLHKEHNQELQDLRQAVRRELAETEAKTKEKHDKDQRVRKPGLFNGIEGETVQFVRVAMTGIDRG